MSAPLSFYTVEQTAEAVFKDRGSEFIACIFPVIHEPDFKHQLIASKKAHPKAVHYCFAYRMGSSGERFRVSDDGEPSGTAGKPIFGQLLSRELTNTGVIVVRYFGGSLLGVPGLINAYKTATSLVMQMIPIIQKFIEIPYQLHFDYRYMNPIMQVIRQMGCTIIEQEMQLFCVWKISVPAKQEAAFLHQLRDFHQVQVIKEKSE